MSTSEQWHKYKPLPADINERIWQILPDLLAKNSVLLAYLFGSLAQSDSANDVDIALLMPDEQPVFPLRQIIAGSLDIERVDLVDLRLANPVLRFEIISTGKLLYADNEKKRRHFEMSVLREYKDTAYLRQHQEQMLRDRAAKWLSNEKA